LGGGGLCFLGVSDLEWLKVSVSEKKIFLDTEKGALLHIIVQ